MIQPKSSVEYQVALSAIFQAARLMAGFDLPSIVEQIGRCEAIGPIMAPSLWIQNGGKMAEDKEMIEAALPLWRWLQKIEQPHGQEPSKP